MRTKELDGFANISEEDLEDVNGGGLVHDIGYGVGYVIAKMCEGLGHIHG